MSKKTRKKVNSDSENYCKSCGKKIKREAEICVHCGVRQLSSTHKSLKSKVTAGLLALFLGGIGIHKFYLGRIGLGIVYLLFFWTFIPAIIGFIEGILYFTMTDSAFRAKYG